MKLNVRVTHLSTVFLSEVSVAVVVDRGWV